MDKAKQDILKEIIKNLHETKNFESAKKRFSELIKNVSAEEIAEMEQALINEGFPIEQIQNLCNVHVAVFEESLKKQGKMHKMPGHPVHTYMAENKELKKIIKSYQNVSKKIKNKKDNESLIKEFINIFNKLKDVNIHYTRKENQLFPFLEKKGFTGPSKVMWAKHDEIRKMLKDIEEKIKINDFDSILQISKDLITELNGMIFKEEMILFPTAIKKLTISDWILIKNGENQIGYAWIKPGNLWDASIAKLLDKNKKEKENKNIDLDFINLDTGRLSIEQINLLLLNLPVDISFIDENDRVLYYSNNKDRIFPRSPGVIGREVQNCHPQKSIAIVNRILNAFKNKEKSHADFWINLHGKIIYIRYFAIYDNNGNYRGTLEVSQDITEIQKLTGERRLLDW
ncbi:MAG TPA: DUF438 domain-containing protein [Spirochaetota bacterium]|nr:DUF438 domain-containing protein [Spirochaetota bacterium]HOL56519.1 DUF438 domain-containing protein [Spirochaetota bacterium]HPP03943.1 DUF438 domain-containing protein [Spirochaetota bacterium]